MSLPLCFYPTTVLFLDDSPAYLNSMRFALDDHIAYRLCESPSAALQFLQTHSSLVRSVSECFQRDVRWQDATTSPSVQLALEPLQNMVYNPHRFAEVSVIVADYAMPEMNGVTFFSHLTEFPYQNILLTGQADQSMAIDAFNDKQIHHYVQKSDAALTDRINTLIWRYQQAFFREVTSDLLSTLGNAVQTCLNDEGFISFFKQLCQDHQIVEYYFMSAPGCFVLLDHEGTAYYLLLKSREDVQADCEMALDIGLDRALIEKIEEGQLMPYFWDDPKLISLPARTWQNYLYPSQWIQCGQRSYVYAWLQANEQMPLQQRKVLSYKHYLTSFWSDERQQRV